MFSTIFGFVLANVLFLALHLESRVLPSPLSPKEEKEEFEKYFNGDLKARNKLVEHNLRLVAHVVKKYYQSTIENDDLMSIGTIGLIKAVQSFSHDKNVRFSTYASKCIENEVLMSMRKLKQIENVRYLDDNIEVDNQNSKLSLKDSLPDEFELSSYCEMKEMKSCLLNVVASKLEGRERQIIIMRYGLFGNKPQTQQQVCEILNISRSYVSRIEKVALERLKEEFKSDNI